MRYLSDSFMFCFVPVFVFAESVPPWHDRSRFLALPIADRYHRLAGSRDPGDINLLLCVEVRTYCSKTSYLVNTSFFS